jgi:RNA polymerase sigma-70 factor (ECF subfamily)
VDLNQPSPTNAAVAVAAAVPHRFDWSRILREHDRWLRTIVHARLGEPQAVDDVMQDVALAAVRQAAPIQDSTRVAPWLYRLAVRQTLLYRRKMGRARNLTQRFADRNQPAESDTRDPGPLEWLLGVERNSLIRQAIESLRAGDAEILMLKYAHNWNYHQIARHLGIGHSAVEARLHRARARMRRELSRLQVIEGRE